MYKKRKEKIICYLYVQLSGWWEARPGAKGDWKSNITTYILYQFGEQSAMITSTT